MCIRRWSCICIILVVMIGIPYGSYASDTAKNISFYKRCIQQIANASTVNDTLSVMSQQDMFQESKKMIEILPDDGTSLSPQAYTRCILLFMKYATRCPIFSRHALSDIYQSRAVASRRTVHIPQEEKQISRVYLVAMLRSLLREYASWYAHDTNLYQLCQQVDTNIQQHIPSLNSIHEASSSCDLPFLQYMKHLRRHAHFQGYQDPLKWIRQVPGVYELPLRKV